MKATIISGDYPSNDNFYGDTFVHSRALYYKKEFDVEVIGYLPNLSSAIQYEFETIQVFKTFQLNEFCEKLKSSKPDVIICHFVQHQYLNFLLRLRLPLIVTFHGFDVLSWKRRLMNYKSPGSLPYLLSYVKENRIQRSGLSSFVKKANLRDDIQFVFVSNWLYRCAEHDLGICFDNAHIIPNGIDLNLFQYKEKNQQLRKKILLLRSFKARNYANDIAIEAISILSKRPFFSELEFLIQGEGYLFGNLTKTLTRFKNVTLNESFVSNRDIPNIFADYGIFLCPSRLDTQGVSMCEAMASGLVPLTTPIGGIPEYATDNHSALYANSSHEMADKIEFLFKNPDAFSRLSAGAAKAILEKCDLRETAQKEITLMMDLTNKSNSPVNTNQRCTRCILDSGDDRNISFDQFGVCSYCRGYEMQEKSKQEENCDLLTVVEQIKLSGKGKKYDSIIGLSGGVDSSYLAYQAKKLGLRPLAVHFDNGWNSELAVYNIERIVNKLNFDLHTFVVDWEEFKDLQLAFIKASVVDIELVTDHAIITKLYQLALQYDIRYILSGSNHATESILPLSWIHDKRDHIHIRAIHKIFGTVPLKTYPLFNSFLKFRSVWSNIKSISLLDLMPYNKETVQKIITEELGWRNYGGKHYESVFTRFYQGYILNKKFKIDKRKAHLSNLICSGQMTRDEALSELAKPAYDEVMKENDYEFVLKKLGLTIDEFENLMNAPIKQHSDYPIDRSIYDRFPVLSLFRPTWNKLKAMKRLT